MDKLIIISLILLFFLLKFYYTFSKDTFNNPTDNLSPSETKMLSTEFVKTNKERYNRYQEHMEKNFGKNKENYGYTILPDTNEESLGFCPLGEYYKGKFSNKSEDVFTKCTKCFKCNRYPGYHYKGGCLGDKDSVCHYGKLPYEFYIKAHIYPHIYHSQIHKHKHKYLDNRTLIDSNNNHIHS